MTRRQASSAHTTMHIYTSPQVQKCIFCISDPQGTHRRFDKIVQADMIKCSKTNHNIFTCGRCTANYHPVAEATSASDTRALPRIILTPPDSEHSSALESSTPDKKALYPAPKRRGRANWIGYKWMPNVQELKTEKARQRARESYHADRRMLKRCGGVKLLAMGALASTPVAFFAPQKKVAAEASEAAPSVASTNACPISLMGAASSSTLSVSLSCPTCMIERDRR